MGRQFGTVCSPAFVPRQVVGKGTASFGKRHNKSHTMCRRCGKRSVSRRPSRSQSFFDRFLFSGSHMRTTVPALFPTHTTDPDIRPSFPALQYHIQKGTCSSCAYPSAHMRSCKSPPETTPLGAYASAPHSRGPLMAFLSDNLDGCDIQSYTTGGFVTVHAVDVFG